ncbi:putative pumilio domain-containing protein [Golovinomyces cichoracearum]|uniref:Pumilio homology domain family member 3 n=1 Tax=Golovinomyces cichoracearum TaxID=62708 RepID=A0A420IB21_9PEZI|nr:putative pumilio domain-containing protein [Golovinomyces cichoracearum]
MTKAVQTDRFPRLGGLRDDNLLESSPLGLSFTKTKNTWKQTNDVWAINDIGSRNSNAHRKALIVSAGETINPNVLSRGTKALAVPSEADSWLNLPWDPPRNTTSSMQPKFENMSSHSSRITLPHSKTQNFLGSQNMYRKTSPLASSNDAKISSSLSNKRHSLDLSSAPFIFKPEDNENEKEDQPHSDSNGFGVELPEHLSLEGTVSRDMRSLKLGDPDEEFFTTDISFGNVDNQPGSASNQTISNTMHSQIHSHTVLASLPSNQADISYHDLPHSKTELVRMDRKTKDSTHQKIPSLPLHLSMQTNFSPTDTSTRSEDHKIMKTNESCPHQLTSNQPFGNKIQYHTERDFTSLGEIENHRPPSMSMYPFPLPGEYEWYNFNNSRNSRDSVSFDRKIPNLHSNPEPNYLFDPNHYRQPPRHFYELSRSTSKYLHSNKTYNHLMLSQPCQPCQPCQSSQSTSTRPSREHDIGNGFRSALLEEFRANTKYNKRYELKDLYHHIVEFCGDQHGSRFIQAKLEIASSDDKEQIFREIQPNALQLMTDVYGNYVIQKLFEHGNQVQKRMLAKQMKNHVMELSLQMYGCRVVQKALEYVLDDQQATIVEELQEDILKCIKDQNGNHVVQKAIERVPSKQIQFIIGSCGGNVEALAIHPYGCRVVQRILEFSKPHDQSLILRELYECLETLISDQYGNYVIQHVIRHGSTDDRDKIVNFVTQKFLEFSKHKFASNVVEKSIIFGTEEQRRLMVSILTAVDIDGTNSLQLMMKDQFGNYVIRKKFGYTSCDDANFYLEKLLAQLQSADKVSFLNAMKTQLIQLKKYNCGKQIDIIEKLLYNNFHGSQSPTSKDVTKSNALTSGFSNFPKISTNTVDE